MLKPIEPNGNTHLAMRVVDHVQALIERGELRPGDKLPPERDLSRELKISRASLRSGIGSLAAMGVIDVRHGVGNFVASGPPAIGLSSLRLLSALHGFMPWHMFETRLILESSIAALAAERGTEKQFDALAGEIEQMYKSVDRPAEYLLHDTNFHRLVSQASGNPILAALMETITASLYDDRKKTVEHASDLRRTTESHRQVYRQISGHKPTAAKKAMERHIRLAEAAHTREQARRRQPGSKQGARRRSIR